jgi:spermidine/putrescine transport system ATP-binding protein
MEAVKLVNVAKIFTSQRHKEFLAVEQLNLAIAEGEFFALLGPSGCGKTTTLRMIAGFELPTSGDIFIQGNPMLDKPPFHRPVNTVFQNYALFPHLNVAENIAFGLEMENLPKATINQRVSDILEQVKLAGMEKRYPRQLSGGQQQRVALARALVKQPAVLLFDEPLGALDLKLRKEMQLELKQMQRRLGMTFIYVTHDQEEALTMCDRIAIMHEGRVLQIGTPLEIYEYPKTKFVADFIGESNFLTGEVVAKKSYEITVLVREDLPVLITGRYEVNIGQIVTLVMRPEKTEIYPNNYEDQPAWGGIIEQEIYIGTDTRYVVRLAGENSLVVRQQNIHTREIKKYCVGEKVKVRVAPDSIRILT